MITSTTNSDYLLLFRGHRWDRGLSPQEIQEVMGRVMAWLDGLHQQGVVKGGHPLSDEGRLISGGRGNLLADAPFAESKEVIGGYLLIQAEDFDAAVAIARTCPNLDFGASIEVRPVAGECPISRLAKEHSIH